MTPTRRDVLKLAALAAAGTAGPLAVTPQEAAALLAQPATATDVDTDRDCRGDGDPTNPARFARHLDGSAGEDLADFFAPEEYAAYRQARAAVYAAMPFLRDLPFDHPWHKLDEAAYAWATVAGMRGIAAGAKYEQLRQALVGPRRLCGRCDGLGALAGGQRVYLLGDDLDGLETCGDCKGAGTVPTPAPTLAPAAD